MQSREMVLQKQPTLYSKGWNNQTGDAVTEGVFENADYTLSMENGKLYAEISKEGYVTNYEKYHSSGRPD